ncbi:D-3-phosphoglycerate dehydrogenase, chloroplastic [Hordeum vulgare]|nr:D-3-phosphoglycerate dehydrogenase, chloroplastic [Hordeum vulgare]
MLRLSPVMLRHLDHARRPRATRSVSVPSPAVDQAIFFLRSHAVTLTAASGVNATSPMAVGRALEGLLSVLVHSLRVTAHHPKHFLVLFTQPAHQVNTLRRGSIRVEGASFNIASWHEHDHAIFGSLHLHVRVIIEMVPMQFWSMEGAEEILGKQVRVDRLDSRTLERGHTKTFACWIWTSDIANIPTSHTIAVLPRGAGRVDEMEGFSPPDRRVAPPPATADYTMLIHVDCIEDWTTPSPRSSHSGQSGLPSSGSDNDSASFPLVAPATWSMGVEDGRGPGRNQRQARASVADLGCRGRLSGGHARDKDGDGRSGGGNQRSWRDVLLRRGRSQAPPKAAPATRHRSRSPQLRRSGSPDAAGPDAGSTGKDPVEDFFKTAPKPYSTSVVVDSLAADVHAAAEAVVNSPLEFDTARLLNDPSETVQLDAFSPTLSAAASDMAARAEWAKDEEEGKVAHAMCIRGKAHKKRESIRCKKQASTHVAEESWMKISAWWAVTDKAEMENDGTYVSGIDPRFDPREVLAADFGWALAEMKCPNNYPSGFTKVELSSSILPIPVAMTMICTVYVLNLL